jgi:tRNA1Val (adenine37-N6)-methyltransferase
MNPEHNETLDSIRDIKLFQAKDGYRFSIDALLLEHFISARRLDQGIELGTGSGIISILLAKRLKGARITAVEIQKGLAGRAARNVHLNSLDERIEILEKNIMDLKKIYPANKFDFVFSNPPFRKTKTGRLSIFEERAVARHEIEITLPDFIKTASYLIKHSGKFFLIYHPFRLAELISLLQKAKLEPKRIRFVHSKMGEEAKMVLIEAVKGSGTWLKIVPPLYIYERANTYTPELIKILSVR